MTQSSNPKTEFLILPSERLLKYESSTNKLSLLFKTRAEDFVQANNKLALISGKSVKYYDLQNGFNSASQSILESYFPKKVEGITIDTQGKIIVTDKFGDIYEARSENSLYLNSNLGIPTFMKHIHNRNNNKEFIILGDDYCKIKVYNYKNMHEVTAIWYIPNSVPLDVLQISKDLAVLLVKHEDKENLKHTYKLYQFSVNDLEEADFKGNLVYADKTVALSNSDYHPCSITYCEQTRTLFFLKLDNQGIEVVVFILGKEKEGQFSLSRKQWHKLPYPVNEGNSIEGFTVNQGKDSYLLISYGQYYNVDNEANNNEERDVELSHFEKLDLPGNGVYKVTEKQFLLKLKLI